MMGILQKVVLTALVATCATACAGTPNVMTGYYESKATVAVKFAQTAKCKTVSGQEVLIRETDFTVTPSYSANIKKSAYHSLDLSKLDGFLANTDVTVTYYDDGRLKSLNTKQTGQAGPIIKSIIELAAGLAKNVPGTPDPTQCQYLRGISSDPVTVIYSGRGSFEPGEDEIKLEPQNFSKDVLSQKLNTIFQNPSIDYVDTQPEPCSGPGDYRRLACYTNQSSKGTYPLQLTQPALVTLNLNLDGKDYATSSVFVPQLGKPYTLPVPKAPLFGENRFGIVLSVAGTPASIGYGASSGIADAITGATAIASAADGSSAAEKAAALKAESDLIAQQQRLVRCRTDATTCQ